MLKRQTPICSLFFAFKVKTKKLCKLDAISPCSVELISFSVLLTASELNLLTAEHIKGPWWGQICVKMMLPDLEYIFSGSHVCDVNPLAVNIMAVSIPAANWDTLLSHVVAGIPLLHTWKRMRRDEMGRILSVHCGSDFVSSANTLK